jgi:hypothetical protein
MLSRVLKQLEIIIRLARQGENIADGVSQTLLLPVKKGFIQKTTDTVDRRGD